jgi:hypothetical protein
MSERSPIVYTPLTLAVAWMATGEHDYYAAYVSKCNKHQRSEFLRYCSIIYEGHKHIAMYWHMYVMIKNITRYVRPPAIVSPKLDLVIDNPIRKMQMSLTDYINLYSVVSKQVIIPKQAAVSRPINIKRSSSYLSEQTESSYEIVSSLEHDTDHEDHDNTEDAYDLIDISSDAIVSPLMFIAMD